jgi:hypothetical protein
MNEVNTTQLLYVWRTDSECTTCEAHKEAQNPQ